MHKLGPILESLSHGAKASLLETTKLEFKEQDPSLKRSLEVLADAVVCMANAEGGVVVVGIDDDVTGLAAIVGVDSDLTPEIVVRGIFDRTRPALSVPVDEEEAEGFRLLIITVPKGATFYANAKGTRLKALAAELSAGAEVLVADLADRAARAALPDRVAATGRVVDVLVNNAGWSTMGPVSASDPEAEMGMIEVDVVAVADLCSRVLPGMVQRGRGAVLNVASTAAFQPLPGQAGYGAGKAFVLSYTQSLAGELRGTGVTATALCPGPVDTGFGERAGFSKEEAESALPSFMWVSAADVARAGVEGMDKGRMVVIPGPANRVAAALAQVTPRSLLVPLLVKGHPGLRGGR